MRGNSGDQWHQTKQLAGDVLSLYANLVTQVCVGLCLYGVFTSALGCVCVCVFMFEILTILTQ